MLIIKFLQTLIKALNSDGTPGQVAAGMALGLALGLTPLMSLHNLVVLLIAMMFTVSFPGFMLGWAIAVPFGFMLDPVFDRLGMALLTNDALLPMFAWITSTPVISLTRLNNSIVLGSLVFWLLALLPMYFVFRLVVARYRTDVYERIAKARVFQVVKASKVWDIYTTLRP